MWAIEVAEEARKGLGRLLDQIDEWVAKSHPQDEYVAAEMKIKITGKAIHTSVKYTPAPAKPEYEI